MYSLRYPSSNRLPVRATVQTGSVSPNAENPADLVLEDGTVKPGSNLLGRYTVLRELGSGTFGYIYEVFDNTEKTTLAVKVSENKGVAKEEHMYNILNSDGRLPGIPYVHHYDEKTYLGISKSLLFIGHLGPSMKVIQHDHGGQLSLKTVMMTGIQLLDRFEDIHDKGILYRDLQPANILIGYQDRSTIYLVDFEQATKYRDREGTDLKQRRGKTNYGTALFMSKNSGSIRIQSRRDDLESLGYVLVYLLTGTLPWDIDVSDGMDLASNTYSKSIQSKKEYTSMRRLLKGLPIELADYFKIVNRTGFEQRPDYDSLRGVFNGILIANNFSNDGDFDWERGLVDVWMSSK